MKLILLLFVLLGSLTASAENYRVLEANETLTHGDIISIVSLSPGAAGTWLEGRKHDEEIGTVARAGADRGPDSSTRWKVIETTAGIFAFECLGFADGPVWLNGFTRNGKVALALSPHGVSGSSWALYRKAAGVNLKCLGSVAGVRWLIATAPDAVGLAAKPEGEASQWQIYVWSRSKSANPKL